MFVLCNVNKVNLIWIKHEEILKFACKKIRLVFICVNLASLHVCFVQCEQINHNLDYAYK